MSEELKPCPFCGGEAEIVDAEERGPQAYVVICNGCMTSSRVIFALMDDATFDLVSAWNTRADRLPVVKTLVWEETKTVDRHETVKNGLGGSYVVSKDTGGDWYWFWMGSPGRHYVSCKAEGFAAAQSDYEARIRASLDMIDHADAQAALDAAIRKAVNEKLEEAAKAVAPMTIKIAGTPYQAGCGQIADTILAMKEPE